MDATTALTGMLPAVILISAPLTALVSLFLLWLYRRSTLRAMGRSSAPAVPPELPRELPADLPPELPRTHGTAAQAFRPLRLELLGSDSPESDGAAAARLAQSAIEPHEFLGFLHGRLSRLFVRDGPDLERRVAELDRLPDADGLYRVTEFFCHADTWKMTMRRLARESRAVLMDLRTFSRANAGCRYELEQLVNLVDLRRVAFLVDDSTDSAYLEEVLVGFWPRIDRASPNRSLDAPTALLFRPDGGSPRALRPLLLRLFRWQDPAAPMPASD